MTRIPALTLDSLKAPGDYVTTMSRTEQERRGKIRTFTGKYVDPLALRPEDICIEDIAHHLANLCRYTGACPKFYSVAQHSVLVSHAMAGGLPASSTIMEMAGLLHDAAEAYLNDLASPVKHSPQLKAYRQTEHEAEKLIFSVFELDAALLPMTKAADDRVFRHEVASWWDHSKLEPGLEPIVPWDSALAEHIFLHHFHHLQRKRQ